MIINVHIIDEEESYSVKPGQKVRYTCDEAGVKQARETGQIVTIGRTIYFPAHLNPQGVTCKS